MRARARPVPDTGHRDVVNGVATAIWGDLHQGNYTRAAGACTMDGSHVTAWVGAYYHPLKLVRDTVSLCKSAEQGTYSLNPEIPDEGKGHQLRLACGLTCASSRSCGSTDTVLNWGDPVGDDHQGDGQLVVTDDACSAVNSYTSIDGVGWQNTQQAKYMLYGVQGYIGCLTQSSSFAGIWKNSFKSKAESKDAYSISGCKPAESFAGDICNASDFPENTALVTSVATNRMYLEPALVGSADVDYRAGSEFNDIGTIAGVLGAINLRSGDRIDAVNPVYSSTVMGISGGLTGGPTHGGSGGSPTSLTGLKDDPVVSVSMCSAEKDHQSRAGYLSFKTRSGRTLSGGKGNLSCVTVAPAGKILYGFYGRSGGELDVLGTIWGDPATSGGGGIKR